MDLITVRDLFKNTEKYAGVEVNVGGWVRNRRGSKQFRLHRPERRYLFHPRAGGVP